MATNFTVIQAQRQHFGNQPGAFDDIEPDVLFVGPAKDFPFDCPDVIPVETAVLMFQSRDVDHQKNIFQINGIDVFGGLPASAARDSWNGNILLIESHHQLRSTGNLLRVESRNSTGGSGADIDDFIIDNVVIMYKVPDSRCTLPEATDDLAAFVRKELVPSITNVTGSGSGADLDDRHNEYVLPTPPQLVAWRAVFQSLLAGSWLSAHLQARTISSTYNVVRFLDTPSGRTYYILMEGVPGHIPPPTGHPTGRNITDPNDPSRRGWGTYVFDAAPQRALSFSAPHPKDDAETAEEAVEAYLALRARTLLIAGADRDQNIALATCAQSERPYFESDVAHTSESVFQMAFEEIYSVDAVTWHLQFHGNSKCKADLFLSNGVVAAPAIFFTLAENIQAASAAAAGNGPVLVADVFNSLGDCSFRGTDNMQMRFASGRLHEAICPEGNDPVAPSRFIHVEQRRDARRAPTDSAATPGRNRAIVVAGILATFP